MATTRAASRAWTERQLDAIDAGQRIAGEEPSPEDREAARRVLTGQASAEQVIEEELAELEARHGFTG
ncbi:MAG: hypothetical protein EPN48_11205 [Microbacteriaceae bacterium]|nr:MAG: hypothetical protein EPN48_11205 [Microbacteriaceae bacterium]